MKTLSRFIIFLGFIAATYTAVQCQDYSKDTFRISAVYTRTDIPVLNEMNEVENVNGFTLEGDFKLIKSGNFRFSVAYNFNRKLNQEVYPDYFDGMNIVDLYRDVNTHSVGGQVGYAIGGAVEPFAALLYGTRKIHTDTPYQLVRTVRFGVNIPFSKKSPFFLKGYLNYEQPYGNLPSGFINPNTTSLGFGGGFRF